MNIEEEVRNILQGMDFGKPGLEQEIKDFLCVVECTSRWDNAVIQSATTTDGHLLYSAILASDGMVQWRLIDRKDGLWVVCPPSPVGEVE